MMMFKLFLSFSILIYCSVFNLIDSHESTFDDLFMNIETNDLFDKDCGFDITASDSLSFYQTIQPTDNDGSSLDISKYTENNRTTTFDELKEFLVLPAQMECSITDESKNLNVDKNCNDSLVTDTFDKYTKELDDSIMAYIMTNYNAAFKSSYVTRLDNIKEVLDLLSAQESDNTNIFDRKDLLRKNLITQKMIKLKVPHLHCLIYFTKKKSRSFYNFDLSLNDIRYKVFITLSQFVKYELPISGYIS
ncbi:hypothetical protein NBO_762g0001, partial [Nosema bombycis CQ1]